MCCIGCYTSGYTIMDGDWWRQCNLWVLIKRDRVSFELRVLRPVYGTFPSSVTFSPSLIMLHTFSITVVLVLLWLSNFFFYSTFVQTRFLIRRHCFRSIFQIIDFEMRTEHMRQFRHNSISRLFAYTLNNSTRLIGTTSFTCFIVYSQKYFLVGKVGFLDRFTERKVA